MSAVDLREANLTSANLDGAYLGNVDLFNTILADLDLSATNGLDHYFHHGPCIVDHRTLARSRALPVRFARGCGVDDDTIDFFLRKAAVSSRYFRPFISYSHHDSVFAEKLYNALLDRGIRCWLDRDKLLPGEQLLDRVSEAIGENDKVLLCCSRSSLESPYVKDGVLMARERERNEKLAMMIALDLDGYLGQWRAMVW